MKCSKCNSTDIIYNSTEGHIFCNNCGCEIDNVVEFESVDYFRHYDCCPYCGNDDILRLNNGSFICNECNTAVDNIDDINSKINELHEYLINNCDKDTIQEFNRIFTRDEWSI